MTSNTCICLTFSTPGPIDYFLVIQQIVISYAVDSKQAINVQFSETHSPAHFYTSYKCNLISLEIVCLFYI